MKDVVARFAPSPTGFLHIGSIRTALINYIIVKQAKLKKSNSKFLLRIEDTDKIRSKNEYIKNILSGLKWLGLNWDDEVVIQSKRANQHKEIANILLQKKLAFKCICTSEELELKRSENQKKNTNIKRLCAKCENNKKIQLLEKNYCVRIKIPNEGQISIVDKIQGKITIKNKEIDNFILLRNDGTPTYMLSVVVDDHDMKINTIIRGNDHLNNTFRQIYVYKHMNWNIPEYAHLPLLHGIDGKKLSKRHGAVDINELKKIGYLPNSIINNLILLGWSPKKSDEIININEIIEIFNIDEMSKSSSIFDYNKLNYFNNNYLKKNENYKCFENYARNNNIIKHLLEEDKIKVKKIFEIYKKNINTYSDMEKITKIYFDKNFKAIIRNKFDKNFDFILKELMVNINKIVIWNDINLENSLKTFIKDKKIKFPLIGKPLRLILTNQENGPTIVEIMYILGKENTFLRLNNYINVVSPNIIL